MSFSEQADIPAEHTYESHIVEGLVAEQEAIGSVQDYIALLGAHYLEIPAHHSNMLQLQRMAGMATNPNGEGGIRSQRAMQFYWGEILAYRMLEVQQGDDWSTEAYALLNQSMVKTLGGTETPGVSIQARRERISLSLMRELGSEDVSMFTTEPADALIDGWVGKMTDDMLAQLYVTLGFRYLITRKPLSDAEKAMEEKVQAIDSLRFGKAQPGLESLSDTVIRRVTKKLSTLMEKSGLDEVDSEVSDELRPEVESIDDVRERWMERYAEHKQELGDVEDDDSDSIAQASQFLGHRMNKYLREMEGIERGETIEIHNDAVYVVGKEDDGYSLRAIEEGDVLMGEVDMVMITNMPTLETLKQIREGVEVDVAAARRDPLTPLLALEHAVIIHADGTRMLHDADTLVAVMIANPAMHMRKLLF